MRTNTSQNTQDTRQSIASSIQKTSSRPKPVQTKLTIGQPNDKYEQEADRVADQVVKASPSQNPAIQKKCTSCEKEETAQRKPLLQKMDEEEIQPKAIPHIMRMSEEELQTQIQKREEVQTKPAEGQPQVASHNVQRQIENSKGGGSPLSPSTRSFMESRMGTDFGQVRIHNDSNAHKLSAKLNAHAFATGNNIFFNRGKYEPESQSGKRLLAHELTHTVQQGASKTSENTIQRDEKNPKDQVSDAEKAKSYLPPITLAKLSSAPSPIPGALNIPQHSWVLYDFPVNEYQMPGSKGSVNEALKPLTMRISELGHNNIDVKFTLIGLASSSGSEVINEELRAFRTFYMRDNAPDPIKDRIQEARPAGKDFYIASNTNEEGRARNRSIILVEHLSKPDKLWNPDLEYKRVTTPMLPWETCDSDELDKLEKALSLAFLLIGESINLIQNMTKKQRSFMKIYFDETTPRELIQNFAIIRNGLRRKVDFACFGADSFYCGGPDYAFVNRGSGGDINICTANFFELSLKSQAITLIHEAAHNWLDIEHGESGEEYSKQAKQNDAYSYNSFYNVIMPDEMQKKIMTHFLKRYAPIPR